MDTKPKIFSKKWFENYWYYYKIHTFIGIFVLLVAVYTLAECINSVEIDTTITYIGNSYFAQENIAAFEEVAAEIIDDVDGDGVRKVYFSPLVISDEIRSEQDMAIQQKIQLEIAVGDTFLYLMDKKLYESYKEMELFVDLSEHLGFTQPTYGVLVSEIEGFNILGIPEGKEIYAAVRVLTQGDEKKPDKVTMQNNAIKILKELYKKG
ncbi:MAG: hypothetical protein PHF89_02195 [Eubacteriales bacterium]|jgi:hypothetical protein|nr:hypothetical protein [Eubacteriales bacterium]